MTSYKFRTLTVKKVPSTGDRIEFTISYEILENKVYGSKQAEEENTQRGRIIVGISRTLQSIWGLEGIDLEKVLVEYTKQKIREKMVTSNLLTDENFQLSTSNSPNKCPFNVVGKDYSRTSEYLISIPRSTEMDPERMNYEWDVFISHASEDKDEVALPLSTLLSNMGLKVWLDQYQITIGDSLREKLDDGLSKSRFGIVIISEYFFAKVWTNKELNALFSREEHREKVILPVWHKVDHQFVSKHSPFLADKVAATTALGIKSVAEEIFKVVNAEVSQFSDKEIALFLEQIKWYKYQSGHRQDHSVEKLNNKLRSIRDGNKSVFELCNADFSLLLKIVNGNTKYLANYNYGEMPVDQSEKLRQDNLLPLLILGNKLRSLSGEE